MEDPLVVVHWSLVDQGHSTMLPVTGATGPTGTALLGALFADRSRGGVGPGDLYCDLTDGFVSDGVRRLSGTGAVDAHLIPAAPPRGFRGAGAPRCSAGQVLAEDRARDDPLRLFAPLVDLRDLESR